MKTLNQKSARILTLMFGKFLNEVDATKKENLQSEIIAKFGKEHFDNALKNVPVIPSKSVPNASNKKGASKDGKENSAMLNALNAIGITDKLKEKGGKSIFKKEFNNKTDRTSCRTKFQNAIALYLMQFAKGKKEIAEQHLQSAIAIANKYYIAESAFKNVGDYCTDNMEAQKRELIKMFIDTQSVPAKKEKSVAPKKKKEIVAPAVESVA